MAIRRRAWAVLAGLALLVALAWPAEAGGRAWQTAWGALLLATLALGLTLLPWRRWVPRPADATPLWQRPAAGERWCTRCGLPAPQKGACQHCGAGGEVPGKRKPASK